MSGGKAALLIVLVLVLPLAAHEVEDSPAVVIDSDMGIDDAVTLALALQCPHIRVSAVVACEGVAGRETGAQMLGRMLDEFNRTDVPLYAAADRRGPGEAAPHGAPAFRHFAEATIAQALRGAPREPLPFTPKAYLDGRGGRTVVLALGPLTNIAAALKEEAVRKGIARIMVQGPPDASRNWNIACDPEAFAAVRESGVPLQFVESGPAAAKPEEWRRSGPRGQRTSIGEGFVARLFADAAFREHYTQGAFAAFTDELLLIACVDDDLFETVATPPGDGTCLRAKNRDGITAVFGRILSEGRQAKNRVVFTDGPLPDAILQPDVRARKAGILARNGETEWFAQLLMNELHEHLGSYSILGVKMGIRAGELLNAPPHGMRVVSYCAAEPPVSCLNDGILVATGSTPGRALFRHEPGPAGSTRVSFRYNGREVVLRVKDEYRKKVQAGIDALRKTHTLEDAEYWEGVRKASLDIWENWHRRDLFDVVERSPWP